MKHKPAKEPPVQWELTMQLPDGPDDLRRFLSELRNALVSCMNDSELLDIVRARISDPSFQSAVAALVAPSIDLPTAFAGRSDAGIAHAMWTELKRRPVFAAVAEPITALMDLSLAGDPRADP